MTRTDEPASLSVHEAFLPREHSLYRPRHSRRQLAALACATVFFAAPALSYVVGVRPGEFENRALTPFPSAGQGWSFFSQLNQWATDHLLFREQAVHAADGISRGLFGEPPALDKETQQGPLAAPPPPPKTDPRQFPPVLEGKGGWMYLGDEISSHCADTTNLQQSFDQLRKLRDGIEASGRAFVVVVAPDKAAVVPEKLPDNYVGKDCHDAAEADFWHRAASENYILDLRSELKQWGDRQGAPVYGSQDAHWSDEGAITATRSVAEKLRPGISASWRISPKAPWSVPADLPRLVGRTGTTDGTSYALMPDGKTDQTRPMPSEYTTPVHADTATGPGTYGLRVAWLGDSFTIRTLPYLAAAFRDLTALHTNTADQDQGKAIASLVDRSDVVVLELAERSLIRGSVALLTPATQATVFQKLSR